MTWLLRLFLPADQYEPVVGDLIEEGAGRSRLWCWRQALRAIVHTLAGQIMEAPLLTIGTVVTALLLLPFRMLPVYWLASVVLNRWRIYDLVGADAFWYLLNFGIGYYFSPWVFGWCCAAIAKGREVSVSLLIALSWGIGHAVWLLWLVPALYPRMFVTPLRFAHVRYFGWELGFVIPIVLGGVLCKLWRDHRWRARLEAA